MALIVGVGIGSLGVLVGLGGMFTKHRGKTKWVALALMMAGGACLIFGQ